MKRFLILVIPPSLLLPHFSLILFSPTVQQLLPFKVTLPGIRLPSTAAPEARTHTFQPKSSRMLLTS